MSITPFGMSVLGLDSDGQRRNDQRQNIDPASSEAQPQPAQRPRAPRRPTSNFNSFQTYCSPSTDSPPPYATAVRHRPAPRPTVDDEAELKAAPPKYTCTVSAEAKLLLQVECISPLHKPVTGEWREVYVILRGTLLSIHRAKDSGPGKLLKNYTLQHAEIGLAPDVQHATLVAQSRLGHLIPPAARWRAAKRDPQLFKVENQHIMRLRLEMDQILLAHPSEDRIHGLINSISAGIDIAPALDERSIPRICTVPRRRRRRETPATTITNVNDPAVIAEQERIVREMYPSLAASNSPASQSSETVAPSGSGEPNLELTATQSIANPQLPPVPEDDDLDLSAMREDGGACTNSLSRTDSNNGRAIRPSASRTTTTSTISSTYSEDMIHATNPANFSASGKWQPLHTRSTAQIQRYVRRCMPLLPADATRASDVLICNGRRLKINWRLEVLEEWELKPPSYRLHGTAKTVNRSVSQRSTAAGSVEHNSSADNQSTNMNASAESLDIITPVQEIQTSDMPELAKVTTTASTAEKPSVSASKRQIVEAKRAEVNGRDSQLDTPSMIFCF